jgi:hypothetical protein
LWVPTRGHADTPHRSVRVVVASVATALGRLDQYVEVVDELQLVAVLWRAA